MNSSRVFRDMVTKDWQSAFPYLTPIRRLDLGRIVGPLLQGLYLRMAEGVSDYAPTLYVHPLSQPSDTIYLSFSQYPCVPNGARVSVSPNLHKHAVGRETERVRNQSKLSLHGDLHLSKVLAHFQEIMEHPHFRENRDSCIESVVSVLAWSDKRSLATAMMEEHLQRGCECEEAGLWKERVQGLIARGPALREVVESEIAAHKLQKLPRNSLIVDF